MMEKQRHERPIEDDFLVEIKTRKSQIPNRRDRPYLRPSH